MEPKYTATIYSDSTANITDGTNGRFIHTWMEISDGTNTKVYSFEAESDYEAIAPGASEGRFKDAGETQARRDASTKQTFDITKEDYDTKIPNKAKALEHSDYQLLPEGNANNCVTMTNELAKIAGIKVLDGIQSPIIAAKILDYLKKNGKDSLNDPAVFEKVRNQLEGKLDGPYSSSLSIGALDAIMAAHNGFAQSKTSSVPVRRDPITVDLDGDGIETTGTDNGVYFDLDGDRLKEKTSWVVPDDGFIVMDRNGNGTIDSGRELFGDATILKTGQKASTGFEALAEQDTNADGVIDKNDENFSNLRVWRDYNQNGISEANELETLEEERIKKIHLDYLTVNADDGKGNIQTRTSGFEFTDGSKGVTSEFLFNRDTIDTQNNDFSNVSDEIKSLPYMRGFGQVTDLYHSMALDSSLKTMVEEFVTTNGTNFSNIASELSEKFEAILFRWAGVDTIAADSRGGNIDARQLAVLEKMFAEEFEGYGVVETAERSSNPNTAAGAQLNQVYDDLSQKLYNNFIIESYLKEYVMLGAVERQNDGTVRINEEIAGFILNYQKQPTSPNPLNPPPEFKVKFYALVNTLKAFAPEEAGKFVDYFASKGDTDYTEGLKSLIPGMMLGTKDDDHLTGTALNDDIFSLDGNDEILAGSGDDTIFSGKGDDIVKGEVGNDTIFAGDGNDQLYGGKNDDTLYGGKGDDYLEGGEGNDTYVYTKSDGNDTIVDYNYVWTMEENRNGKLKLIGLETDDIAEVQREGTDLVISFKSLESSSDSIRLKNCFRYYAGDDSTIKGYYDCTIGEVEFADGTKWDYRHLVDQIPKIYGTSSNDIINGTAKSDIIHAGAGDDTIFSGGGDDTVFGGIGKDIISGESGKDVLYGEDGDDTLTGGAGDDQIYGNNGNDLLYGGDGNDSLQGGEGSDTIYGGKGDDYLDGIEEGWDLGDMGSTNILDGGEGNDTISGGNGNDVLIGGDGGDIIRGREGNDLFDGGKGNDTLNGGDGNDTYIYRRGDGSDIIIDQNIKYSSSQEWSYDRLKFEDILSSDVENIVKDASDLVIQIKATESIPSGSVRIKDWFISRDKYGYDINNKIEEIEFADGTVWDSALIESEKVYGSSGNDLMTGTDSSDKIYSLDGDDAISAGKGNDLVEAGNGDDILSGEAGNDILNGGEGSDTYIYRRGDGNDTIIDYNDRQNNPISYDKLKLEGINPTDIEEIFRENSDLIIKFKTTDYFPSDSIRFKNWLDVGDGQIDQRIEEIEFSDGTRWTPADLKETINTIYGTNLDDNIIGTANADALYGKDGSDVLEGGNGDDYLNGGEGNDTYIYHRGDGNETIEDLHLNTTADSEFDKLKFEDINASDIYNTVKVENDFILNLKDENGNAGDKITFRNWFYSDLVDGRYNSKVEGIEFADGTKWDIDDIQSKLVIMGSDGNDRIEGTSYNDIIYAGKGNDSIHANSGDDQIYGGDGNDTIIAGEGQNLMDGGKGDDYLMGFQGADTYVYRKGDGNDTIYDSNISTSGEIAYDKVKFEDINPDDIYKSIRNYDDLILILKDSDGNSGDRLTFSWWFYSDSVDSRYNTKIEEFEFADGTKWDIPKIEETLEWIHGSDSNDYLDGGEEGNDTYFYARGGGNDIIHDGNNLQIGKSFDKLKLDGIIPSDISNILSENSNLIIILKATDIFPEEKITIANWFNSDNNYDYKLESIEFANGTKWTTAELEEKAVIIGTDDDDWIDGTSVGDKIYGFAGNDQIFSGGGDDTLAGGAGNDYLEGSEGSDTYIYCRGDENDTIYDLNGLKTNDKSFDKLKLDGINSSDISQILKENGNLIIIFKATDIFPEERITIANWFNSDNNYNYKLESVEFANGTKWTTTELEEKAVIIGTEDGDYLYGTSSSDKIYGLAGNDQIHAGNGDDILNGGSGSDYLEGNEGNDTYIYRRGDGDDTIYDFNDLQANSKSFDRLKLEGINPSDISQILNEDGSLVIVFKSTEEFAKEKITISNWIWSDDKYSDYKLEEIEFDDGTKWGIKDIEREVHVYGTESDDYISGGSANETILSGKGNDEINGGEGSDTYIYRRGDGSDLIYEWNNYQLNGKTYDKLEFDGVNSSDIANVHRDGNDLILTIKATAAESEEKITFNSWFFEDGKRNLKLEEIKFSNGEIWTTKQVEDLSTPVIYGDNVIQGGDETDYLWGGKTNDTIYGGAGDDYLSGGLGNNTLNGEAGNDVYYYDAVNGGNDVIIADQYDSIEIGFVKESDIVKERLSDSNDLVLKIVFDGICKGQITLKDYYLSDENKISKISFYPDETGDCTAEWTKEEIEKDVNPKNNPLAVAADDSVTINEDTAITINVLANDSGINGSIFALSIKSQASNGTVIINPDQTITYIPKADYNGVDNFTYEIPDGNGGTSSANVNINVLPVNDAPLSADDNATTIEDKALTINVLSNDSDIDGDILVPSIKTQALNGTLIINQDKTITYTPNADYSGTDSFTYEVSDGNGGSSSANVSVNVTAIPSIYGTDKNDILNGTDSRDRIYGGKGNDTLYGNGGDDKLFGGEGSDTYVYRKGDGNDTILDVNDLSTSAKSSDTLRLEGFNKSDIFSVVKKNLDLIFTLKSDAGLAGNTITISNWFSSDLVDSNVNYKIETFKFDDGSLSNASIENMLQIYGTDNDDSINGFVGNDTIFAGKGDDIVHSGKGNDTLYGNEGNDRLYGDDGTDILDGGAGDDTLEGGEGSDTYVFRRGDGNDTMKDINDLTAHAKSSDTLRLEGFNKADIYSVLKQGNDLLFTLKDSNGQPAEKITLANWFYSDLVDSNINYKIETFKFDDGSLSTASIENMLQIYGTEGNDVITGFNGNDTIYGGSGDDVIDGVKGNDILYGENGNDILLGSDGNDTLIGGTGDDILQGGEGSDTYVFHRGDGNDTIKDINDLTNHVKSSDTLRLEGFNKADIYSAVKQDNNLLFTLKDINGQPAENITFVNWFYSDLVDSNYNYKIETFKFDDGSLSTASIENMLQIYGTDGNDVITGFNGNDTIFGGAGDDVINGLKGNDTLYGEDGNDTLMGSEGNDTLIGGTGDDMLIGSEGSDTYIHRKGDGNDIILDINDLSVSARSSDTLKLEGYNKADISSVVKSEQNLILSLKGTDGITGDTITVKNWFYSDLTDPNFNYKMESVKFDDATLSTASIENMLQIYGTDNDESINGLVGNDTIFAGKGNDIVHGGKGNDILYGNEGDDTLYGEDGNDTLYGGAGNNILDGGLGTDTAVYSGKLSDYKILTNDGKQYVFKQNTYSNEIDSLLNIESLKFADQTKAVNYTNFTETDTLKYIASYQEKINQYGISDAKGDWTQTFNNGNKDFATQGYKSGLGSFDSMGYLNSHKTEIESVFGKSKATEENGLKYYISHSKSGIN